MIPSDNCSRGLHRADQNKPRTITTVRCTKKTRIGRPVAVATFSRQPLVATGWGDFPTGYFPIGALPIGALPTTGAGGGGCGCGRSAAAAAFSVASDAVTMRNFIRRSPLLWLRPIISTSKNANRTNYSMSPLYRKVQKNMMPLDSFKNSVAGRPLLTPRRCDWFSVTARRRLSRHMTELRLTELRFVASL
jgi:hypothetical protein